MKTYILVSKILNEADPNLRVMDRQRIQVNTLQAQSQRAEKEILKAKRIEMINKQKIANLKKQISLVKAKPTQVKTISTAHMMATQERK